MSSHVTRRGFLAACAASASLAGCAAPHAVDDRRGTRSAAPSRRTKGTDVARGNERTSTARGTASPDGRPPEQLWDTSLPGKFTLSAPALAEGTLYIGSSEHLHAIGREDGSVEWSSDLGALTHRFTPVVVADTVVMAARDMVGTMILDDGDPMGSVAGVNPDDGTLSWNVSDRVTATPAATEGRVFVPVSDPGGTRIDALDPGSGLDRWTTRVGDEGTRIFSAPAVADGRLFVGVVRRDADRGRIVALSTDDGSIEWSVRTGSEVAPPRAVDDGVVFGTVGGSVGLLDAATGDERWRRSIDAGAYTRPEVADGAAFVAAADTVRGFELDGGRERWSATVESVNRTGIAVADGTLYVGGITLTALAVGSGSVEWNRRLPPGASGTFGKPTAHDGAIYTGSCIKQSGDDPYDHHVYAFR